MIDFTEQELEIIFDALEEKRLVSEDDDEALLIETIFDKIWKASKSNE
jgi:hypothetical protein